MAGNNRQLQEYEAMRDHIQDLTDLEDALLHFRNGLSDAQYDMVEPILNLVRRDIQKQKELIEQYGIEKFAGTNPLD